MAIETAATLLERERELSELEGALTKARAGRGGVVLVEAPAGLGKTSLLRAASETAAETGFTCLRARASELERDFAYGCVRQLLEPAVAKALGRRARPSVRGRRRTVEAALRSDRRAAQPPLGRQLVLDAARPLLAAQQPRRRGSRGALGRRPPLVRYGVAAIPQLPGPAPGRPPGRRPRVDAQRGGRCRPTWLGWPPAPRRRCCGPRPLSIEATATLCEREARRAASRPSSRRPAARPPAATRSFSRRSCARPGEQEFSTDAREAARVRRHRARGGCAGGALRLSGAPAAATALVRAVAVLGDGASLAEAAQLAGIAEDEAARAADLLVALAILKPAEGLEFAHPIVREAVYADIGSHERAEAHARAAEILAARGASEERIAAQIVEAEPAGDPDRVELLRRVAADALARGAPAAAVAWLRRGAGGAAAARVRGRGAPRARLGGAPPGSAGVGRSPRGGGRADPGTGAARDLGSPARERADHVGGRRPGRRSDRVGDRASSSRRTGSWRCFSRPSSRRTPSRPASRRRAPAAGGSSGTPTSPGRPPASAWCWRASPSSAPGPASRQARRWRTSKRALAGGRLLREQERDVVGPVLCARASDCWPRTRSISPTRASSRRSPTRVRERRSRAVAFVIGPPGMGLASAGRRGEGGGRRAHGARAAHAPRHPLGRRVRAWLCWSRR